MDKDLNQVLLLLDIGSLCGFDVGFVDEGLILGRKVVVKIDFPVQDVVAFQEGEDLVGEGGAVVEVVPNNHNVFPGLRRSVEVALRQQGEALD
jgi:hypothetical protein